MKCNLPKGFRANIQEESFDQREQQPSARATFVDRKNISLGAGSAHRVPQATGRTYDFSKAASDRRRFEERRHEAIMRNARMKESERNLQARIARSCGENDSNSEMS